MGKDEFEEECLEAEVLNRKKNGHKGIGGDLREYVRQYCEVSSIQGLSYIINTTNVFGRVWWIVIFMLGIVGSYYMVYQIMDKWISSPVLVSLATKEESIEKIPFPAVTICPEAKVSGSCFNYTEILIARKEGRIDNVSMISNIRFDFMASICRPENHESTFSLLASRWLGDLYDASSPILSTGEKDYEDTIKGYADFFRTCEAVNIENAYCSWMGQTRKCSEIMTPILTDQGLCYSFNMYDVRDIYSDLNTMEYYDEESNRRQDWNPDRGFLDHSDLEKMYPRRAFLSGAKNAFVAVFLTDKNDVNYACQDFALQGLRVSLHTPSRIPRLGQIFFSVGLDRLTTVSVIPTVSKTSNKIKQYNPETRSCFFGYERKLKYFKYYSQSSCSLECWTNYTISKCGCVAFYMPRDNTTTDCKLKERFCLDKTRVSYNEDILRQRLKKKKAVSVNATTICNCLPLCSDITYNAEIASSDWNFNDIDEVEFDENREEMSRYGASAVKVFFKNKYFLPTRRDELYGTSDMISNIGGALGLFTGFALVSVAEVIYFVSVKLIDNYVRHKHWVVTQ